MRRALTCHRETSAGTVESIAVEAERGAGGGLWLRFHAELLLAGLALPDPAEPERADGLWRTTCFELFLREPGVTRYYEFNFSPSSRWAAYRFDDVREGMGPLDLPGEPSIGLDASESHFALEAELRLPDAFADVSLRAALSAVIEETDGTKSYWALAHPPGKPDFHHPDCFTLELPPPSAA